MRKNDAWVKAILVAAIVMLISQLIKSPLLMAVSFPVISFSWMWLGALRKGKIGACYQKALLGLLVIWLGGFGSMTIYTPLEMFEISDTILGFPPISAVMIYIVWLLPVFVGTLPYGLNFETDYLSQQDIEKIDRLVGEEISIDVEE